MLTQEQQEKFWQRVDRRGDDECWPWTGERNRSGYGRLYLGPQRVVATRLSWELANGRPFPTGALACHTCDNPSCVNPAHLWPGTPSDNVRDAIHKGRWKGRRRTRCAKGHELVGDNLIIGEGHVGCRACEATASNGFGHGGICRRCGHARVDDYQDRSGTYFQWRCRVCTHLRKRKVKPAALSTALGEDR